MISSAVNVATLSLCSHGESTEREHVSQKRIAKLEEIGYILDPKTTTDGKDKSRGLGENGEEGG